MAWESIIQLIDGHGPARRGFSSRLPGISLTGPDGQGYLTGGAVEFDDSVTRRPVQQRVRPIAALRRVVHGMHRYLITKAIEKLAGITGATRVGVAPGSRRIPSARKYVRYRRRAEGPRCVVPGFDSIL